VRTKNFNREVLYPDEAMVRVDRQDIAWLKQLAGSNERRRMRLCTHQDVADPIHEMLIVHGSEAYVRPHKHLNRGESFHVLEGEADALFFDEEGNIADAIRLGDYTSGSCFYCRMDEPVYHTLLIYSPQFVFHETTSGPFDPMKTMFSPWSPADGDGPAIQTYLQKLRLDLARFREGSS
jgi:cupin fold WbuC family metalloprotein